MISSKHRPCAICFHHPGEHKNGVCNACDPDHVPERPEGTKVSKSSNYKKVINPNINSRHEYEPLPELTK